MRDNDLSDNFAAEIELKQNTDKALYDLIDVNNNYRRLLTTVQHCYSEGFNRLKEVHETSVMDFKWATKDVTNLKKLLNET